MSASKDGAQAMERLNFYINRGGANLSAEDKKNLEAAKKKLSEMIAKKEDVDEIEEAKKVTYARISKAAQKVVKADLWVRELVKLGLDKDDMNRMGVIDPGTMAPYISPIIVGILLGRGVPVDSGAKQQARAVLTGILAALKSTGGYEAGESVESVSEGKKVTLGQIHRIAKKVINETKWNKELASIGIDPSKWDEGWMHYYITPIIVGIAQGQGLEVGNAAMTSARQMLATQLKLLKGAKTAEEDMESDLDELAEAIGESLVNRMTKAMVEAPQFVKLLKGAEKYIAKRAFIEDDMALAVRNAIVMTLAKHDASLAGSLPGQAKRETKKAVAEV
jgi:hypothetical protein